MRRKRRVNWCPAAALVRCSLPWSTSYAGSQPARRRVRDRRAAGRCLRDTTASAGAPVSVAESDPVRRRIAVPADRHPGRHRARCRPGARDRHRRRVRRARRRRSRSALTVTVTATEGAGFATVLPGRRRAPEASTSNWDRPGQTRANTALVRLSDGGAARIWVAAATDLVVDVAGAFVPAATSAAGRYVRSRSTGGRHQSVGRAGPGRADHGRVARAASRATQLALAVNITFTETTGFDFVAAYPAGSAAATTSVVNADGAGQTRAAGAVVPFRRRHDAGDRVRERRHRRRRRIFHGGVGDQIERGLFVPATPTRVLDTRSEDATDLRPWGREIDVLRVTGGPVAAVVANWTLAARSAPDGWRLTRRAPGTR